MSQKWHVGAILSLKNSKKNFWFLLENSFLKCRLERAFKQRIPVLCLKKIIKKNGVAVFLMFCFVSLCDKIILFILKKLNENQKKNLWKAYQKLIYSKKSQYFQKEVFKNKCLCSNRVGRVDCSPYKPTLTKWQTTKFALSVDPRIALVRIFLDNKKKIIVLFITGNKK